MVAALLDQADEASARALLTRCCGASRWVEGMLARRPFESEAALLAAADVVWQALGAADYLEAFTHHPQIGADMALLRAKYASTAGWSSQEQSSVQQADETVLLALRDENQVYLARFGFIFIVCATAKTAHEMLALLRARLSNEPVAELSIAAGEQQKITKLRLSKLVP